MRFFIDPVAEFVVTLTLNTIKRISESIESAKNGEWVLGDLFWMCGQSKFHIFMACSKFITLSSNNYYCEKLNNLYLIIKIK